MSAGVTMPPDMWREWSFEPGILAPLLIGSFLYARGALHLRSRGARRVTSPRNVLAFATGMSILALALVSPLHEASEQTFSAHMIQHELLMAVAAPLLVIGHPGVVLLWSLPQSVRRSVSGVIRRRWWRAVWRALTRPFDAWLLHGVVIWVWHVPVLFQSTLTSDAAHALQHLSFLGSGLLFWWSVVHPARRAALGSSIVYLFLTAVHTGVLGALMTVAHTPWYPAYRSTTVIWGLTPLADQQLAGLVMWIPASVVYLVAALIVLRRWIRESEWTVARHEGVEAALTT